MKSSSFVSLGLFLLAAACGPTISGDPGGGDGVDAGANPGVDAGPQTVETNCFDGRDDDGDGLYDCADPDCASACNPATDPEDCGEATHSGDPLAIPDGVGMSYATSLIISGFDPGQTLTDVSGFLGACVTMEHSWLRDLHIELICPTGEVVVLQQFLGQTGSELYMGEPNDNDGYAPVPGVGYEYCWRPTATNPPMLEWSNANPGVRTLPPGDYQASSTFNPLVGCGLNGIWTIQATDDWGIDNGFIFGWTLEFNPDIISDCEGWDVE